MSDSRPHSVSGHRSRTGAGASSNWRFAWTVRKFHGCVMRYSRDESSPVIVGAR
jgi:hypothetical protein